MGFDTFATVAVQSKVIDIITLAAILGDTVNMVISTYAGVGDEDLKHQGMEEIGKVFESKVERDD